jgi:hypothetical protein
VRQSGERSYDATFLISHGVFQLTDERVVPELAEPAIRSGDLLVPHISGGATVVCGIDTGPVRVRAEVHASAPAADAGSWEEVAETIFDAPVGSVRVVPLFEWPVADIGPLTTGPGNYRIRVSVRGRETARHRFVETPTEDYLIQVWPDVPSDQCGRGFVHAVGVLQDSESVRNTPERPGRGLRGRELISGA